MTYDMYIKVRENNRVISKALFSAIAINSIRQIKIIDFYVYDIRNN